MQLSVVLAHDREQIAADTAHHRTDHAHHRVRGDRGIDRMTSLRQHHGTGL
jgi:hypothetical protein